MFEIQYCKGFEFVECTTWESFHNGFGILFSNNVVIDRCNAQRTEGLLTFGGPVASGSGVKVNISQFVTIKNSTFSGWNIPGGLTVGSTGSVTGTPLATDSNGAGIALAACDYNTIIDNVANGNVWGVKEIKSTTLRNSPSQTYTFTILASFGSTGSTGSNVIHRNEANANGLQPVGATGSYIPAVLPSDFLILNPIGNPVISTNANGSTPVAPYVNMSP